MSEWHFRFLDAIAWIALGIIMLAKIRKIVDWIICHVKRHERRRCIMREARKTIYEMTREELTGERRRLLARAARERARGSEGIRMVTYRLRLIEGRMRQLAKKEESPESVAAPAEGQRD